MDSPKPVSEIIKLLGGPTEAARKLNIKPNVVMMWRKRRSIPADRVLAVEAITGVSRHEMRPDVFGPAKTGTAA